MRFVPLFLCALFMGYLSGCSDPVIIEEPSPDINLSQAEQRLVEADNRFGLTLFQNLGGADADKNVFISPLSVSVALGMTLNGAAGDTRAAMAQTLELAGLSPEDINTSYRSLLDVLTRLDNKVTVEIANSIWHRDSFAVEPDFLDDNRDFFDAQVQAIDFNRPEAADTINDWVDENTKGKISEIVQSPIGAHVVMYLINATYFKGDWRTQFEEDNTQDDAFRRADGTTVPVRMMTMAGPTFPMLHTDKFQAIDLPYGDSLFSMTLFLPHEGYAVGDLLPDLTPENWQAWISQLTPRRIDLLQMPKFKLEYEKSLVETLAVMGMDVAFDPQRADFSLINSAADLYISEVKHKTFVEVDEKGTEAAAVTSVEVVETSAGSIVRIDRPFVFAIREQATGTILFIGQVMDPSL